MPSKPVHLWFYKYCILINYANQKLPINDFTNNLCNLHSKKFACHYDLHGESDVSFGTFANSHCLKKAKKYVKN